MVVSEHLSDLQGGQTGTGRYAELNLPGFFGAGTDNRTCGQEAAQWGSEVPPGTTACWQRSRSPSSDKSTEQLRRVKWSNMNRYVRNIQSTLGYADRPLVCGGQVFLDIDNANLVPHKTAFVPVLIMFCWLTQPLWTGCTGKTLGNNTCVRYSVTADEVCSRLN